MDGWRSMTAETLSNIATLMGLERLQSISCSACVLLILSSLVSQAVTNLLLLISKLSLELIQALLKKGLHFDTQNSD
jgi:hypothetical protein